VFTAALAVCGVARQSSALSTGVAFGQTSRDDDRRIASGVHAHAAHAHLRRCLAGSWQRGLYNVKRSIANATGVRDFPLT